MLQKINGHGDLINLTDGERAALCDEIRQFLISSVARTGGHLASNLGVVELTVALETVFDTEKDRLVFDVGHQSYVHKLLTGRQADFTHLRQFGGIAGFPKPSESDSDAFVAGHASSSVSIALGMARARTLLQQDYHVIALMGDGAATGGMAYEGLNDAADSGEPMIVILNDNEMSIDRNVGGMARHLSRLRTKERYLGMKERYRNALAKIPGGNGIYRFTRSVKDRIKRVLLPTTIFENMGFTYLGPVDGHDLPRLISLLRIAGDLKRPVLIHVLTQKGKGYSFAEENPSQFHGVSKFDAITGKPLKESCKVFSDAFGEKMVELAANDHRICAITAAMPGGTGLLKFKDAFPKRLFDVGIAEEHAVSMAGGLAKQGMVPVVALYSTFLQRSYDQILQDIAMLHLHVVLAVDRAGLVGEDGETHHGVFDVGFLRQAPGMRILCPVSCAELEDMLQWAVEVYGGPVALRYPRGGDRAYTGSDWNNGLDGAVKRHRVGSDYTIITYGTLLDNVMKAADILEERGIAVTVLRLLTLAPLPTEEIVSLLPKQKRILIAEEACGGVHEALAWELRQRIPSADIGSIDLGNQYITHGSLAELYKKYGLDAQAIADHILEVLSGEN
ncbi:MAG: 1-deoxy-D-xylulose-5-phosphate synthase [Oscillospiraceae bacterium]|nr:1-deoxy-D-xylulose-5-phosphate synthase [Oscillospiraceae bacterium]